MDTCFPLVAPLQHADVSKRPDFLPRGATWKVSCSSVPRCFATWQETVLRSPPRSSSAKATRPILRDLVLTRVSPRFASPHLPCHALRDATSPPSAPVPEA